VHAACRRRCRGEAARDAARVWGERFERARCARIPKNGRGSERGGNFLTNRQRPALFSPNRALAAIGSAGRRPDRFCADPDWPGMRMDPSTAGPGCASAHAAPEMACRDQTGLCAEPRALATGMAPGTFPRNSGYSQRFRGPARCLWRCIRGRCRRQPKQQACATQSGSTHSTRRGYASNSWMSRQTASVISPSRN
jgi:hypothetical protein